MAIADPSISWGEGRVQVIAMVAFSESDREAFQTVFEQLVEVFSERDSVQRIVRRGTDFGAFLDSTLDRIAVLLEAGGQRTLPVTRGADGHPQLAAVQEPGYHQLLVGEAVTPARGRPFPATSSRSGRA